MFICAVFIQFLEILDLWSIQGSLNRDLDLISSQKLPKISKNFRAGLGSLSHLIIYRLSVRVVRMLPLLSTFLKGSWGLLEPIPVISLDKGIIHPGRVASPYWWQRPPCKVPTAHQKQFWGSVSCSRILWHVAQFHPRGAGIRSLDELLYPLSYSRPIYWKRIDALNSKIQNTFLPKEIFCLNIFYFHICWHLVFQK